MIKFNLNLKLGSIDLDGISFFCGDKSDFLLSEVYENLYVKNEIKKSIPYHYMIDSINWFDKEFEMIIRPICFNNVPFMMQLIDKHGEYFSSIHNWDKVSNIDMLNKEVDNISQWLSEKLHLKIPFKKEKHVVAWELGWGVITASYDVKSFNCGVYITWK